MPISFFDSCSKQEQIMPPNNMSFANRLCHLDLVINDKYGNNLLAYEAKNKLTENDINVYFRDGRGKLRLFYNKNLKASKGYLFSENDIRLFLLIPTNNELMTLTYLKLGKSKVLEFKTEYNVTIDYIEMTKVWLDNQLIWSKENESHLITIILSSET